MIASADVKNKVKLNKLDENAQYSHAVNNKIIANIFLRP